MKRQGLYLITGVLLLSAGLMMGTHQLIETQEKKQLAAKWTEENESVEVPSPFTWVSIPEDPDEGPEPLQWEAVQKGEQIGTLKIPSADIDIPIWEGTSTKELDKGIGHHESTDLPGGSDSTVLAGHRETAMASAGKIKEGDLIVIEGKPGKSTYRVEKTWVTDAEDRSVVVRTGEPILRIYTCYPLTARASTDHRYIIEARLVQNQ